MNRTTTLRRLLAATLTLTMAILMNIPAFAADTGPLSACLVSYADMPLVTSFSDVPGNHTFCDAITWAAGQGIVGGYADGSFRPGNSVTKAQFCVMLSRAFYSDEIAKYANPEGSKLAWFAPNATALYYAKVLPGTSFEYQYINKTVMDQHISRYDMAQLMTNIMRAKGFTAGGKSDVQAKIADYESIPDGYRDAVGTVYALGIIGGYGDGSFKGDVTMNRGQAAAVIYRMAKYAPASKPVETKPETPVETVPETPGPTTVAVTTSRDSSGDTRWKITNNDYSTGTLNNGKPVTQANVLAMLADAKKIWPDGLTWADMGDAANNNFYGHGGTDKAIAARCVRLHNTNEAYACGGFAAMLSDYVFGPSSNPVRKLSDNLQVRPGDIVFCINPDGSVAHVNVAVTTVVYNGSMPCVYTANGNSGGAVNWRSAATDGKSGSDRIDDYERTPGQWCRCIIYTRYPE